MEEEKQMHIGELNHRYQRGLLNFQADKKSEGYVCLSIELSTTHNFTLSHNGDSSVQYVAQRKQLYCKVELLCVHGGREAPTEL